MESIDTAAIVNLADKHGLTIQPGTVAVNEMGLDFRIVFATGHDGTRWVLRMPRRKEVAAASAAEARTLQLVQGRLSVAVPDWQIRSDDLIAYPLLPGRPGLVMDGEQPQWHADMAAPELADSLGKVLAQLHDIDPAAARAAGVTAHTPAGVRIDLRKKIERVDTEIGVGTTLRRRWEHWLDDDSYWPGHSVLVHGDLYAAHIMVNKSNRVTGLLDWTEAQVGDPAIDFTFQQASMDPADFDRLLDAYEAAGGTLWPRIREHCRERFSAFAINYALFALQPGNEEHLPTAAGQLQGTH